MKKLLFIILLTSLSVKSQNFWTEYSATSPLFYNNTKVSSISIVDENTTWISLDDADGTIGSRTAYSKSTNGGSIWNHGAINTGIISGYDHHGIANIHGISESVAYSAVYSISAGYIGGIWKTSDGGINWTRQDTAAFSSANSFPALVYFWNTNEGVAMGDAVNGTFEVYTTTNGGDLWVLNPVIAPLSAQEFLIQNNFEVNGNTIWVLTDFGRILKSSDRGLSWTALQPPIFNSQGSSFFEYRDGRLAFSDSSNGLLLYTDRYLGDFENSSILYKTTDGGFTWTEINYTGPCRNFDITAVPGMPNAYISVGSDNIGRGSSYSVDAGYTWANINNNPDTNFVKGNEVAMLNADHGFAGTYSTSSSIGGIFKWSGGDMLREAQSQLAISPFTENQSITVSPNPTLDILNISGENIIQIEVTDVLGKEIKNLKFDSLDTVNLNFDFLTSGIYLLKVTNDKGTVIKKFVKQ